MRSHASEASVWAAGLGARARRRVGRIVAFPFAGSLVLLGAVLLAIATDVADHLGLIPFGLLLALHVRRARQNPRGGS